MIKIDGSLGEGGGQILRSSLTLSLITGKGVQISNIRTKRKNPGLQHQHLCAVKAVHSIGRGEIEGAELGSTQLTYQPDTIHSGQYKFDIKTAGATTLVLQTIILPLSLANSKSHVKISGGTHVPWSPSFHFLDMQWLPYMTRLGFNIHISLDQAGFYPQGGGLIQSKTTPVEHIKPITIEERGDLIQIRGISAVANLDRSIAERQRNQVLRRLGDKYRLNDIRIKQLPSRYKGTILILLAEFESSTCCYFSLGKRGKPAEQVADDAVNEMESFMDTDGVMDEYLADQLLLPLAIANGPSIFKTPRVTSHLLTNAEVIKSFIDLTIFISGDLGNPGIVSVVPKGHFL
jgi:RNA 3'-terminal phosphate cyclase (ATP)